MRITVIVLTMAAVVLTPVTIYATLRPASAPLVHVIYVPSDASSFCMPTPVEASGRQS